MATLKLTNNVTAVSRIQPWTICEVVFKGVEEKSGTAKDGSTWKAIQFKFSGENGIFEPMFFCPKEDGDKRNSGESNGRKWEMPSQVEQLALTIAHVVGTLSPANYAKLQNVSLDLPKDFDKLVELVKKALNSSINKTVNIKVAGDNRGYAAVPNFVNISRDGIAYISNNWIGEHLAFSPYEVRLMESRKNAKPTEMKESPDVAVDDSDLDFEI